MELRNRRGGITPAEGCMFAAVVLFVLLLVGILYIAFMRFRNPPQPTVAPPATASVTSGHPETEWLLRALPESAPHRLALTSFPDLPAL